jgi:hypothetical protein
VLVPSRVLAFLSLALRRLEAAAARAPELTPEEEAELELLVGGRAALDGRAAELAECESIFS